MQKSTMALAARCGVVAERPPWEAEQKRREDRRCQLLIQNGLRELQLRLNVLSIDASVRRGNCCRVAETWLSLQLADGDFTPS